MAVGMAMYFAEAGYIPTTQDYSNDPNRPRAYKLSKIKKIFRGWSFMVTFTKSFCPELMHGITDEKPIAVVKPLKKVQAKPASKAAKEEVDGKGI